MRASDYDALRKRLEEAEELLREVRDYYLPDDIVDAWLKSNLERIDTYLANTLGDD